MNKVCLCFPLPFFLLLSGTISSSVEVAPSPLLAPQADATGVESPRIFLNDRFPFTTGFGLLDVGNSGNNVSDNIGGVPDAALEVDPLFGDSFCDVIGGYEAAARVLDTHGVLRWP